MSKYIPMKKILFYMFLCGSECHLAEHYKHEYFSLIKAENFGSSI